MATGPELAPTPFSEPVTIAKASAPVPDPAPVRVPVIPAPVTPLAAVPINKMITPSDAILVEWEALSYPIGLIGAWAGLDEAVLQATLTTF